MLDEQNPFQIKDRNGKVIYTTSREELEEVLVSVLSAGEYVKTFSLHKGKIELTFKTISEEARMTGYELMRVYADANESTLSKVKMDSYNAKVNIALQLIRVKTNGHPVNLSQGSMEERIKLLSETPENMLLIYNRYLILFSDLTSMAFDDEETVKN